MQLYALDNNTPILAIEAVKQKNYTCPECLNLVHLRGGPHRQFHFYHLRAQPSCRQHQKSLPHLQLQLHFKSLIPNSSLEKSFPEIGRIADVAWEDKRLIFEIQCSPISQEEAQARTTDYSRIGYTVIWILHDRRFNKKNLSSAENFLRSRFQPYFCYFARGTETYDQFDIIQNGQRIFRGPRLPVDLLQPLISETGILRGFSGDWIDRSQKTPQTISVKPLKRKLRHFNLKKWYLLFFHALLKKFCA